MSKLISDSYLYRAIGADIDGSCGKCAQSKSDCLCHSLSRMDICGIIEDAPTTDVAPVVHGRWIWDDEGYHCSECFYHAYGETGEVLSGNWHFCPNCGAKMEGEDV